VVLLTHHQGDDGNGIIKCLRASAIRLNHIGQLMASHDPPRDLEVRHFSSRADMPPIEKRREYQPNGDAEMAEWLCSSRTVFWMETERKKKEGSERLDLPPREE
jgi:hypothetical protein